MVIDIFYPTPLPKQLKANTYQQFDHQSAPQVKYNLNSHLFESKLDGWGIFEIGIVRIMPNYNTKYQPFKKKHIKIFHKYIL